LDAAAMLFIAFRVWSKFLQMNTGFKPAESRGPGEK